MLRRTWPSLILVALSACAGSGISPEPPTAPKTAAPITAPATDIGDRVDALLEAEWKASGVSPAGPASDAQFFRRAYLDLAGTLPPPEAVTAFLADTSPDKRARAVDALLASPRYAERWAAYWEEVLLRDSAKENIVDRAALRAWLRARFAENAPWDRVARDLVTATGKSSPGGSARERRMAAAIDAAGAEDAGVNGAVNWLLQFKRSTEDLAGATSRTFLGVQIQCAQCHDHKLTTFNRRRLLQAGAGGLGAWLAGRWLSAREAEAAEVKPAAGDACIVLWMNGGPSHIDTFDPKPGSKGGGPFRAIKTSAKGF
jgi:hypothetical protein